MTMISLPITAVTVYTDRARVTRSGKVALEPGLHRLEAAELPARLNPSSLRAAARGSGQARLLGVQGRRTFSIEAQGERLRELEAQLEAAQDELNALNDQAQLVMRHRSALHGLIRPAAVYATAMASGELSVEAQLALFESLRARAGELDTELGDLARREREVERRKAKIQKDLDQWRGAPRREAYSAVVELEVGEAGEWVVDLSYLVVGAGWQPLYDLRLMEASPTPALEIAYLAQVTQGTGEAWQEAALTLSTARPALAGRMPELPPWYVQPRPLPPPEPGPRVMKSAPAPAAMRMMADEEGFEEALLTEAAVGGSGATVTYRIPGTVSIPGDGSPHKVSVATLRLEPDMDHAAAPKLAEAVYRRARLVNESPYTLLPGPANLYSGDEFTGTIHMELTAPQGEIEIFLGVDDRLKVERELTRREEDKRLIGNRKRILYGYEITLQNLLPVETRLRLEDHIPVPRSEEIRVKLETTDPRPNETTPLNQLRWDLALPAGKKQVVRYEFTVEFPVGMEVLGLPG